MFETKIYINMEIIKESNIPIPGVKYKKIKEGHVKTMINSFEVGDSTEMEREYAHRLYAYVRTELYKKRSPIRFSIRTDKEKGTARIWRVK